MTIEYAVIDQQGNILKTFDTLAGARGYTQRWARVTMERTRTGLTPVSDMHTVELERLEHYREQLRRAGGAEE